MSKLDRTERLRAAARLAEEARIVAGAKKDGGGQRAPVEAADSLRSSQTAQVLDLLSEGEIGGLVNGERSIYLDGVPLKAADGSYNFNDVAVAWTHGTQGQAALPELSGVQNEVGVGVAVPFATPAVRTISNVNVDTVRVTINVPQISSTDTSTGDINGSSFTWAVEVQANGGGYVEVFQDTVSGKKMSSYKRARKFPLTGSAPWNVRVRRISADSGSANVVNAFLWDSYTEIQSLKLRYPNSALNMLAVNAQHFSRIPTRAYDILGIRVRVPSNYNPITRAYTATWNGTFQVAWTNNPAWVFLELISNERWGLGGWLAQAGLNAESAKWQLYTISQYCDGMVPDGFGGMEPRFTCNAYIQTREQALQVVQHFAAIFRGAAFWAAGELHITQDAPSEPVALFTPANVVGGRFSYQTGSDKQRHSVFIVYWNDLTQLGRRTPEVWSPDHLVARFGLKEIEVEPIGITRRGQALRLAKWMAYTEEHEGRVVAFKVGSQGALVLPGQVCQVADPSEAGERLGGRIHAATASQVTLDAPVTLLPGEVYTLTVQLPDPGDQAKLVTEERAVTNAAGPTSVLNLAAPYSQAPAPQAVWILQSNNIAATTWRCLSCRESDDGTEYEITALAHDPAKFAAVEDGIVLEPRPVTRLSTQVKPPTSITLTPTVYQDGQTFRIKLIVSWVPSNAGLQHIVAWRVANGSWVTMAPTVDQSADIRGLDPGTVQVEVRAINTFGTVSPPALASTVIAGNTVAAAAVTGLGYTIDALGALIDWDKSTDFDWDVTEVRGGASWDTAAVIVRTRATDYRLGWLDNGTYPILVRHSRRAGPLGPVAAINVTINDAEPLASVLEGLIGPEQLKDFAVDASKLAGGSVDASKLALEIGGGNVLANSSFEADSNLDGYADSWDEYTLGSTGSVNAACITFGISVHGVRSQRIVANALAAGAGNRTGVKQIQVADPSRFGSRKLAISMYFAATVGVTVVMEVLFQQSSSTLLGSMSVTGTGTGPSTSSSQRIKTTGVTPAATERLEVRCYIQDGTGAEATLLIDAVQVEFGDVVTAYAPRPDEILPGTVYTAAIANGAVQALQIAAGAVTAAKTTIAAINAATGNLNPNTVDAAQIITDAVTSVKLAAGSVTAAKTDIAAISAATGDLNANTVSTAQILTDAVTSAKLAAGSVTAAKTAIAAISAATGQLNSNTVDAAQLVTDAVTSLKIAAGAVTAAKTTISAINSATGDLTANSVTANSIAAGAVVAGKIAADAVTAATIAANAVVAGKIAADAVTATTIAAGSVVAGKIAADAVTATTIAANAVVAGKIAADAVTATKIAAGAVVAGKIAADAVTAGTIAANTIGTTHLVAGAVTTAKITAGAVTATELAAGSVTTAKITAGAVTATEIATDAVTANKIVAGAIVAGKIAAEAVGANEIAANAITTAKLLVTGRGRALNDDPPCSDLSAWSGVGTRTVVTGAGAPVGTTVIRGTNATQLVSRRFPVEAAKQYKVSLWARQVSGGGQMIVRLSCYDASGGPVNFTVTGTTPVTGPLESLAVPGTWTRYSGFIVPGAGSVFAELLLHINWSTTGVTDVTDVRCEEYFGADLIVDGSIVATKLAAGAITVGSAVIQNGAIVNAHIGNLAVDNAKISSLDAAKINTGSLDAARIAANSLNANKITAGTITTDRIVVGAATAAAAQAYASGSQAFGSPGSSNTTGNSADMSFTSTGAAVTVHGKFDINLLPANTAIQRITLDVDLRVDGIVVDSIGPINLPVFAISGGVFAAARCSFVVRHTPSAGTHSYDFAYSWDLRNSSNTAVTPNGGTWNYQGEIIAQENKV